MTRFLIPIFLILAMISPSLYGKDEAPATKPEMKKEQVMLIATGKNNPRNSEGAFVTLGNGDIIHVYSHYYGNSSDDHATAWLGSRRSSDQGKTWTKEDHKELENEGKLNVMSVSLLRLQSGALAMFYVVKESSEDCRLYMRKSTDEAVTWGERVLCISDISEVSYNVVNNDRVIQLKDGRLVVPVGRHAKLGKGPYDYNWNADVFCMISDDEGKTWRRTGDASHVKGVIYQEPGVVELATGEILLFIRTNGKAQYMAWSKDRCETWTVPVKSKLDAPLSPVLIKRIPKSDKLLAIWNPLNKNNNRTEMDIAVLSADGREILNRKRVDQNPKGLQYPSIHFVDDQTFLAAWFSWPIGIFIYRMNIDDIMNP